MKTFYVVWRLNHYENGLITTIGKANPTKLHDTVHTAKEDALRLAASNPNVGFTVCRVNMVGEAIMSAVDWTDLEPE